MLLALCFLMPMFIAPVGASAQQMVQVTVPGYTPDEVDEMALDPQSWRLPHDTRFNRPPGEEYIDFNDTREEWDDYESYVPFQVVDWEEVRQGEGPQPELPPGMEKRVFRGAVLLFEFVDKPMISSLEKGTEMMGNPQVDTGVYGLKGEERTKALQTFWGDFLNESVPTMNRGHNITKGWLEYSAGQMMLDLEVYGPFTLPFFSFSYSGGNQSFWGTIGATQRAQFGDVNFAQSGIPIGGNLTSLAASRAVAEGVPFVDNVTGDQRFNFIFFTFAGYCQSPTWQEMGPMMFADRNSVAATEVIADPVTRDVIEGVTGMDFTGYARIQNIIKTITVPGFNIIEEWPDFHMSNIEALWRDEVQTTRVPTPTGQTFANYRTAWENENICANRATTTRVCAAACGGPTACHIAAFRAEFPASVLTNTQVRTNIIQPAFLRQYAEDRKFDGAAPAVQAFTAADITLPPPIVYTQADIAWVDGHPYLNGEEYTGDVENLPQYYLVSNEMSAWADAVVDSPAPFAAFASLTATTSEAAYGPIYSAFLQTNSNENIIARLLANLQQASEAARTSTVNPYFQSAPSRYIPWSSWYGGQNIWSHASSLQLVHPMWSGSISFSAQGEGSSMGTYSHELGHIVNLPDCDNGVYTIQDGHPFVIRALLGGWDMMARGAHVGYYGGHTRWNIPGIRAGSAGTGVMMRSRVASGFTDLTTRAVAANRNPIRADFEKSKDIKYVPYQDFVLPTTPPVIVELYGRNMPTNRGFLDAHGNPIEGYIGLIIETSRTSVGQFVDRTPGLTRPIFSTTTNDLRWGNNLLGVDINGPQVTTAAARATLLAGLPRNPHNNSTIIDPDRWNWAIGGNSQDIATGTIGFAGLTGRIHGFNVEVIERSGHDSFNPDHGVVISRASHTNAMRAPNGTGGTVLNAPGSMIVDAHPGNNDMVQFWNADGTPYMMECDHHAQISTAAFHAGLHNNPTYYRDVNGQDDPFRRFLPDDPRPGYAGSTVNEWVDEYNNFHFYILNRINHDGVKGQFKSYEVAVRNTAANAWKADGELKLEAVGGPLVPAKKGNFARQTYSLTNTGSDTDIVRITLGGKLAETVFLDEDGLYPAATKAQNAVLLNNLYAVDAGETIEFDVFVKSETGLVSDYDLTVTASSETNGEKADAAGLLVLTNATTSAYVVKLNGNKNDLYVTVKEFYSDGTSATVEKKFVIDNNAAGNYAVDVASAAYTVYVDTKGNTQIRDCRIVAFKPL